MNYFTADDKKTNLLDLHRPTAGHVRTMSPATPYVAFFDLDDTLLSTNSGKIFWDYCFENKIYSAADLGFLTVAGFKFITGLDDTEALIRNWAKCFKGWREDKMDRITQEMFDQKIQYLIRDAAQNEIETHKKRGARTVILSASTKFICERVKKYLTMDDALYTSLGIENGIFTGTLASPYIYAQQKYLSALSYCQNHGYDITSCYYYGDAYADHYVMDAVGFPVCVSPDRKLRAYAAQKNWNVVEW